MMMSCNPWSGSSGVRLETIGSWVTGYEVVFLEKSEIFVASYAYPQYTML